MQGTPRKHRLSHCHFRKAMACGWINPEKYSAEEFEVHSEIPAPRRKREFDLSSSCSVPTMKQDRLRQG